MLKPAPTSDGGPKDKFAAPKAHTPSFEELMMRMFSGPMRFESPDEAEEEAEMAAEEAKEATAPTLRRHRLARVSHAAFRLPFGTDKKAAGATELPHLLW